MTIFVSMLYHTNWQLWQLKDLAFFKTWWRHRWHHECMTHNLHNYTPLPIYACKILFVWYQSSDEFSRKHNDKETDELVQEICNSISNTLELRLSCTNPLKHTSWKHYPQVTIDVHNPWAVLCMLSEWNSHLGNTCKVGFWISCKSFCIAHILEHVIPQEWEVFHIRLKCQHLAQIYFVSYYMIKKWTLRHGN